MSNDAGNPQIAMIGKATRFIVGGRNCPVAAQRRASPPWSVKRAVLRIMRTEFRHDELPLPEKRLRCIFCPKGQYLTGAQIIAIRLVLAAMTDYRAMERLTRIVDGSVLTEDGAQAQHGEYE